MTRIDLIVLGMLKGNPLSAYDIQKLVESRSISQWVKISTPSIYKKTLQLEENHAPLACPRLDWPFCGWPGPSRSGWRR